MWARAAEIPLLATPRFVVRFATTTVTHLRTEGTSSGYPDEVSNEHYFSESPMSEGPEIERAVHLRAHEYSVVTQHGVFAHDKVDKGTAVLLDKVPEPQLAPEDLAVDVGCGWGPVTLALAHEAHGAEVWGVDVNERARELYLESERRTDLIRFGEFTTSKYLWQWKGGTKDGMAVDNKYNIYPIPNTELTANPNLYNENY